MIICVQKCNKIHTCKLGISKNKIKKVKKINKLTDLKGYLDSEK